MSYRTDRGCKTYADKCAGMVSSTTDTYLDCDMGHAVGCGAT